MKKYILLIKFIWGSYRGEAFLMRLYMTLLMWFVAWSIKDALEAQAVGGKG